MLCPQLPGIASSEYTSQDCSKSTQEQYAQEHRAQEADMVNEACNPGRAISIFWC